MGACLKTNTSLQRLDLDHNRIGPKSLAAIAAGLQSNRALVALSLESNPLTGEVPPPPPGAPPAELADIADLTGVAALAEALKGNATLASLNLFQTGLTRRGGGLLREGVEGSGGLVALQVSPHDGVADEDLAAMVAHLRANGARGAEAAAAGKRERAAARRVAAEAAAAKAAAAVAAGEAEWVAAEVAAREAARAAAEFEAYRRDRMAELERETAEKVRQARLKEEAEAKAKKAKK